MYLDMPSALAVQEGGHTQVYLRSTGNKKTRITAILCCSVDNRKLPRYMVSKRKTLPKNGNFPENVIVCCQDKGCIDEALVLD